MIELLIYLFLMILGLLSGSLTGLIGASSVMLVVPFLTIFLGEPVHASIGTSLMVDAIVALLVSFTYYREGNTDLKSGLWLAGGAIVGSQIGVLIAQGTPETSLKGIFAISTIVIGFFMLLKRSRPKILLEEPEGVQEVEMTGLVQYKDDWRRISLSLVIGVGLGVVSGLTGAGGGIVFILILTIVMGYPLHLAIGTATLIMALVSASGSIGYAINGDINILYGILIGTGAVTGGLICSRFANKINENVLRKIMGIIFVSVGIMMIVLELLSYGYSI